MLTGLGTAGGHDRGGGAPPPLTARRAIGCGQAGCWRDGRLVAVVIQSRDTALGSLWTPWTASNAVSSRLARPSSIAMGQPGGRRPRALRRSCGARDRRPRPRDCPPSGQPRPHRQPPYRPRGRYSGVIHDGLEYRQEASRLADRITAERDPLDRAPSASDIRRAPCGGNSLAVLGGPPNTNRQGGRRPG